MVHDLLFLKYLHVQVFCFNFEVMERKKIPTPNFDRIQPGHCVNAKLRRLHRLINSAYQKKINPFGLRGSMLSILFIIGKSAARGVNVNQKQIADMLVLDPSTMSRDLKRLEEKGWVRRVKGEKDARVSNLEMTDSGYLLLEEVSPVWEKLHQKVENVLGMHNITQITILAEAIKNNLDFIENED